MAGLQGAGITLDSAAEWIRQADEGGIVYLPVDALQVDTTGRPVILSHWGVSTTVANIIHDRRWKPEHAAYACRLVEDVHAPTVGPVALLILSLIHI